MIASEMMKASPSKVRIVPSLTAIALAASLALASTPAHAQSGSDRALAEALFQEGKKLMAEGKYGDACPKISESQRIDPGAGTMTALALCHRGAGKTATSWAEFKEVISLARRDGRADREQVAQENIAELEPKLSKLRVVVDPGAESQRVEVRIDESVLTRAAFGQALPVDPGVRRILATAPGKKSFEVAVTIGLERDEQTVKIPRLDEDARASEAMDERSPSSSSTSSDPNEQRLVVPTVIALGVGVAGVAVGSIFGVGAMSKQSSLDDTCTNKACPPSSKDDITSLKTSSMLSTIGFVAGGVGLVSAAVLYFVGKPSHATIGKATLAPMGNGFGGTF